MYSKLYTNFECLKIRHDLINSRLRLSSDTHTFYSVFLFLKCGKKICSENLIFPRSEPFFIAVASLRKYSKYITMLQITQMVLGGVSQVLLWLYKSEEKNCPSSDIHIISGLAIAVTYGALFTKLYVQSYNSKRKIQ